MIQSLICLAPVAVFCDFYCINNIGSLYNEFY